MVSNKKVSYLFFGKNISIAKLIIYIQFCILDLLRKEIFYISNLLSLSRFLLLGITVFFLMREELLLALLFIFLIWISDLMDGYFARSRNEISELGKIIDPVADKVSIITIVFVLLIKGIIPFWYVLITVARDLLILIGGLYLKSNRNIVLQSNWLGKIAVFTIGLTLFLSIFQLGALKGNFGNFFMYHTEFVELLYGISILISLVMILISVISYFNRFMQFFKKNT